MRLIDADLLIKELEGCTCTDKHDEKIIKDFCVHAVYQQPTAYDLKEVVKQLEEQAEKYMNNSEKAAELGKKYERHMIVNGAKGMAFEQAIEIVKGGEKHE